MPNISSLTMPDGIVYSIKDSIARKEIEEIKKLLQQKGIQQESETSETETSK